MNCANCCQPIRETEPRDGIEAHDGEYEFRYVHEDGNPVCDGMFQASPGGDGYGPAPRPVPASGRMPVPDGALLVLQPGDMITISWSGELRTVTCDCISGTGAVIRDLTEDEQDDLDRQAYDELEARRAEAP